MKKFTYFLILWLLIWLALPTSFIYLTKVSPLAIPTTKTLTSAEGITVRAVFFYSPTCGHCHYVIKEILPPLVKQHGDHLQIVAIDVTVPAGQALYRAAVAHYRIPDERQGVPTLVVGETILVGSQEILEKFSELIETGLAADGTDWPDIPGLSQLLASEIDTATPSAKLSLSPTLQSSVNPSSAEQDRDNLIETGPVYLAYFFDPTCLECTKVSANLADLQVRYPQLVVQNYELPQEAALNEAMSEKYGVPDEYHLVAPMIFIGQEYLLPPEISPDRLQTLIEDPEIAKALPPWSGLERDATAATGRIVERFNQFSLLTVAVAGLLDGINPCAFTTLIFFVSYLALVGRKGRDILLAGAAFTLAVFLTYLLMGLGLVEVVRQFRAFSLISRLIYGFTAIICLGLAAMSLWDYLKIRQGRLTEISLQLPKGLKQRIHQTIRSHSRMQSYVGAAFTAGILVSLFELACTGQVYLPTIVFVTGMAELRLTAIAYLILYNLMFVVPLVLVFSLTYWGTSSRQLTTLFQTKAGTIKLLTSILFGLLGLWLGYIAWLTS